MTDQTEQADPHIAAQFTGAPSAAAAESVANDEVDLDEIRAANRRRCQRLPADVPGDYGGGTMWVRSATAEVVQKANDEKDRTLRIIPWVRAKFGRDKPLTGKPATEINRRQAVNCLMGWRPDKTLVYRKRKDDGSYVLDENEKQIKVRVTPDEVEAMGLKDLRDFVEMAFLPPLNLGTDAPSNVDTEEQINYEFFLFLHGIVREAGDVPAAEIHRLGENFRLGHAGSGDLDE